MTQQQESLITDEIRALIGVESEWQEAWDTVQPSEIRRFAHAIMDPDPAYWDEQAAPASKFGSVVAPPLFPAHAFRRAAGDPDPLDALASDREWDGLGGGRQGGLPPIRVPLKRILNGGTEAEFFQLTKPGDRIRSKARYADIFEREGRSGRMVFAVVETTYANQDGDVLAIIRNTIIRR